MLSARVRRINPLCWLAIGWPLFAVGCSYLHMGQGSEYDPRMAPPFNNVAIPPALGAQNQSASDISPVARTVSFREVAQAPISVHVVPIGLAPSGETAVNVETILQMARSQNAQIALARKRVDEAAAAECDSHCCPIGRLLCSCMANDSEGGPGGRHAAAARTWQRRAELARTMNETLLDVGNTYFDLLTARRGEAIGHELEKYQQSLLRRSEDLAKTDRSASVLVESLRSELAGRHAALARLHQQAEGAAAKLAYLLNQPPDSLVVPADITLEPVDLVDASPSVESLIQRAQSDGPGVRELNGLLATIEEAVASVPPCLTRLPQIARQLRTAQFKLEETRLALDDLRGKLAAGVLEARGAIQSGRGQISDASDNIRHAAETYRLSDLRLTQNAPGASTNDVLQSIRGLELAHFTHLSAVAAYNKAQVRLLLLFGYGADCAPHATVPPGSTKMLPALPPVNVGPGSGPGKDSLEPGRRLP